MDGSNNYCKKGLTPVSLLQHKMLADVADGSLATEASGPHCRLMSALTPIETTLQLISTWSRSAISRHPGFGS